MATDPQHNAIDGGPKRSVGPGCRYPPKAFTLIELLVVIGIIAVLISILIPTISHVRKAAYAASTQATISSLASAIEAYQQVYNAYPGPLSNDEIYSANFTGTAAWGSSGIWTGGFQVATPAGFATSFNPAHVTGSENLTLGLLGGLSTSINTTTSKTYMIYDPSTVGNGPSSLNTLTSTARHDAFLQQANLDWQTIGPSKIKTGAYSDDILSSIADTIIPEFVDNFPQGMPILYLRARVAYSTTNNSPNDNSVVTIQSTVPSAAGTTRNGPYQLDGVVAYTGPYSSPGTLDLSGATLSSDQSIGVGKSAKGYSPSLTGAAYHGLNGVNVSASLSKPPPTGYSYQYPYNAYPYFTNPTQPNTPRAKDAYILISPGPDRVYGTADDITSFGSVTP